MKNITIMLDSFLSAMSKLSTVVSVITRKIWHCTCKVSDFPHFLIDKVIDFTSLRGKSIIPSVTCIFNHN